MLKFEQWGNEGEESSGSNNQEMSTKKSDLKQATNYLKLNVVNAATFLQTFSA